MELCCWHRSHATTPSSPPETLPPAKIDAPKEVMALGAEGDTSNLSEATEKNSLEGVATGPYPDKGAGEQPQAGKSKGKGVGKAPKGKGGMSYKEKQQAELAAKEEELSAPENFKGKDPLSEWELAVLQGATDQEEGPYGGRKFLPSRGYFACKRCGIVAYLAAAKFVH